MAATVDSLSRFVNFCKTQTGKRKLIRRLIRDFASVDLVVSKNAIEQSGRVFWLASKIPVSIHHEDTGSRR
jgi:hypothetical protein